MVRQHVGLALRRAFDQGVHLAASALYMLPAARPGRHGLIVEKNVPYLPTGLREHTLDVYRPEDEAPGASRPVVLYIHGGAFCMLSKDTHRVMALPFARHGCVVFNINYRLGPTHTFPAPLEDAAAALAWVLRNAPRYGGDPERLIVAGESAGANLVTAIAYAATHPRPEPIAAEIRKLRAPIRAAIPIYGFLDVHDMHRFTENPRLPAWAKAELSAAAAAYVGRPIAFGARRSPLASPLRLLEGPEPFGADPLPPFFTAVGTRDPLLDDSRRLEAAIKARGGTCELRVYPGEIHGFNAMMWRPAAKAKWRALLGFVDRHVGLPAAA